jgi:phosphopantetheinyl transferase
MIFCLFTAIKGEITMKPIIYAYLTYHHTQDFTQSCLRHFASEHHIEDPLPIERSENGKPTIVGNPFFFSKSYASSLTLVCCGMNPLAVDCQEMRAMNHNSLRRRFFHPDECHALETNDWFYRIWCAKECIVKRQDGRLERLFPTFSSLPLLNHTHPTYQYFETHIDPNIQVGILSDQPFEVKWIDGDML